MVINFIVIANSFLNYIFMLHMHIHIEFFSKRRTATLSANSSS